MDGWLTTGQMIDQLKVGEIAECKQSDMTVTRGETGQILVTTTNDYTFPLTLNFKTLEAQWRILPKYVGFEEAMKVLKEGRMAYFHPTPNETLNVHKESILGGLSWFKNYTFADLIEGKWTIETK